LRHTSIASEQAERELARHRKLVDEGWESADALDHLTNERDLRASERDTALAHLERAQAQLALAESELARAVLLAPFDGIVAEVTVELGERVLPLLGSGLASGAVELYAPTSFHVVAPIDETDCGRVTPGLDARVTLDSRPGQIFEGHVAALAPYVLDVEEQNRTVEVEVELDPESLRGLLPGTSADVEILVERAPAVLHVPTACVQPGETVLVLDGEVLAQRRIERGLWNWEWTEVRSELDGSEWLVAPRGQSGLVDGAAARKRVEIGTAP
jgi:HlyD family secretion protein